MLFLLTYLVKIVDYIWKYAYLWCSLLVLYCIFVWMTRRYFKGWVWYFFRLTNFIAISLVVYIGIVWRYVDVYQWHMQTSTEPMKMWDLGSISSMMIGMILAFYGELVGRKQDLPIVLKIGMYVTLWIFLGVFMMF